MKTSIEPSAKAQANSVGLSHANKYEAQDETQRITDREILKRDERGCSVEKSS